MRSKISLVIILLFTILCSALCAQESNEIIYNDLDLSELTSDENGYHFSRPRYFNNSYVAQYLLNGPTKLDVLGVGQNIVFLDGKLVGERGLPLELLIDQGEVLSFFGIQNFVRISSISSSYKIKKYHGNERFDFESRVLETGYIIPVILVILIGICFAAFYSTQFRLIFSAVFQFKEQNESVSGFSFVLLLLVIFGLILLSLLVHAFYGSVSEWDDILYTYVIVMIMFCSKIIIEAIMTNVFFYKSTSREILKENVRAIYMLMAVLALMWLLDLEAISNLFISITLFLVIWLMRKLYISLSGSRFSILSNISYLCASEIIPLLTLFTLVTYFL